MLKNKNIIYFFVSGRKDRIQNNDVMAKEFFYGYHHLNKNNSVEIIEFNDNLAKPNNLKILKFTDKVIRNIKEIKFIEDKDNYSYIIKYNEKYEKRKVQLDCDIKDTYYGVMIEIIKSIYVL